MKSLGRWAIAGVLALARVPAPPRRGALDDPASLIASAPAAARPHQRRLPIRLELSA